jgi:hypothetical protein
LSAVPVASVTVPLLMFVSALVVTLPAAVYFGLMVAELRRVVAGFRDLSARVHSLELSQAHFRQHSSKGSDDGS